MCLPNIRKVSNTVKCVFNQEEEINEINVHPELPEHFDNPFINKHLVKGILGFYYENKNGGHLIYRSPEAKTFCYLMSIKPLNIQWYYSIVYSVVHLKKLVLIIYS